MMLITGLSMSPGFNAIGGILLELMGGRQSARTLHFISAGLIVGFIVVHVGLVVWTGFVNNMRAMITGWFVIEPPGSSVGPKLGRKPADDQPGEPS
jgi:thiosulfate reductase cytochrome b subunit